MTRATFALSAILAVGSYGCVNSPNPSAPTGASLADRLTGQWTLVSQQLAGEEEMAPPAGSTFGFQVIDGRTAVTADCNRCSGPAVIGDDSVRFGPSLACTRAYCTQSAPFDYTFLRLLADENAAVIEGSTLTLRSERGILRFRR